ERMQLFKEILKQDYSTSQVFVEVGDTVKVGDKLFILEAMKMENEIDSPISGIIKNIAVESGVAVEKGTFIMEIEE
ncbi:MAG: hypothetical protein HN820_07140, partial [Candidatus Marinimicrobia bacterium]|nr:hypothetical protein [Candidatus Neomarinimicrobiota bacterium]